jgi:hypothetical protein
MATPAQMMKRHRDETRQLMSRIQELVEGLSPGHQSKRLGKDTLRHAVAVLENLQGRSDASPSVRKSGPTPKRPIPRAPPTKKSDPKQASNKTTLKVLAPKK